MWNTIKQYYYIHGGVLFGFVAAGHLDIQECWLKEGF